jgi:hypothetical protein
LKDNFLLDNFVSLSKMTEQKSAKSTKEEGIYTNILKVIKS